MVWHLVSNSSLYSMSLMTLHCVCGLGLDGRLLLLLLTLYWGAATTAAADSERIRAKLFILGGKFKFLTFTTVTFWLMRCFILRSSTAPLWFSRMNWIVGGLSRRETGRLMSRWPTANALIVGKALGVCVCVCVCVCGMHSLIWDFRSHGWNQIVRYFLKDSSVDFISQQKNTKQIHVKGVKSQIPIYVNRAFSSQLTCGRMKRVFPAELLTSSFTLNGHLETADSLDSRENGKA